MVTGGGVCSEHEIIQECHQNLSIESVEQVHVPSVHPKHTCGKEDALTTFGGLLFFSMPVRLVRLSTFPEGVAHLKVIGTSSWMMRIIPFEIVRSSIT